MKLSTNTFIVFTCILAASASFAAEKTSNSSNRFTTVTLSVEFDGVLIPNLGLAEPLQASIEVIEYQDGTELVLRKRAGRTRYHPIQLIVDTFSQSHPMFQSWIQSTQGRSNREQMQLRWLDAGGQELQKVRLTECWVSNVSIDTTGAVTLTIQTEQVQYLANTRKTQRRRSSSKKSGKSK